MGVFADTVAGFGRRLGLRNTAPGDGGVAEFHFGSLGRVLLESAEPWALVTLVRPRPAHDGALHARLLAACHWSRNHPVDIHPGAAGEGGDAEISLTARLPLNGFTAPAVEELVALLAAILDGLEKHETL